MISLSEAKKVMSCFIKLVSVSSSPGNLLQSIGSDSLIIISTIIKFHHHSEDKKTTKQ